MEYKWPGNIRELKNVLERIVLLEDSEVLGIEHLPENISMKTDDHGRLSALKSIELALNRPYPEKGIPFEEILRSVEMKLISKAMEESKDNQSKAARLLRLNRDKLRYRLKNTGQDK
jgi:two-component system response regulator AtoC